MTCAYCRKEITSGEEVSGEGYFFCNSIHRYSWKQSHVPGAETISGAGEQIFKQPVSNAPENKDLLRKIIASLLYSVVSYFLLVFILGALMGGVAGMEAGQNGDNPAEAGRQAGENFARTYGLFIFILCFILSTIGSFQGLLPMTRSSNKAKPI